jgi:hypothetical protein
MATFKILAGDFGVGTTGQVLVGALYKQSGQGFSMPMSGHSFRPEHIPTGMIQSLEIATEENLKRIGGAIGWGAIGGIAFGPVGALAVALAGGRGKEITFVCQFKDGRRFLGRCNAKVFTQIHAPPFELGRPTRVAIALAIVGLFLIAILVVGGLRTGQHHQSPEAASNAINPSGVKFASILLQEDLGGALLDGQKSITQTPIEDLLGWAELDWRTTASIYDAAYQSNEIAADNSYKDKRILIAGIVDAIDKDFAGGGHLTLSGEDPLGVQVTLADSALGEASEFRRGQRVSLVCRGSGRVLGVATLDGCEIARDYIDRIGSRIPDKIVEFLTGKRTLRKEAATPLAILYVLGQRLPADSPCLNGQPDNCVGVFGDLEKNTEAMKVVQKGAEELVVSLGVH